MPASYTGGYFDWTLELSLPETCRDLLNLILTPWSVDSSSGEAGQDSPETLALLPDLLRVHMPPTLGYLSRVHQSTLYLTTQIARRPIFCHFCDAGMRMETVFDRKLSCRKYAAA